MRVGPGKRAGLGRPREAEAAALGRAAGRRAHLGPGPHRDKDGEGRARHVEADAARARRRSRSYSPIRKRRRDSPSFMEPRRITRYGAPLGTSRRDLGGRTPGTSWGCRMDLVQGEVEAQGEKVGVQ